MSTNSRLTIQNTSHGMLWIRKNKHLRNVINHQADIDKICFYAKDSFEAKYQFLIKKQ